eukprot:IDg23512t1
MVLAQTESRRVRYEVGISLAGDIVWVNGPWPCGSNPDIRIFRHDMKQALMEGERVVADSGYSDDKCVTLNVIQDEEKQIAALLRARHETVNGRFKAFEILRNRYRHNLDLHLLFQRHCEYRSAIFEKNTHIPNLMRQHLLPL